MEDIKKFLRLMDYESLLDLCAAMLFKQLTEVVDLQKELSKLKDNSLAL